MASTQSTPVPERTTIGGSLEIPRMINGLWQLAGGHDQNVDIVSASNAMDPLILTGLNCFDMADHYGDAELVVGQHHASSDRNITAFTKWCPAENGIKSFENAENAVDTALKRMGQDQIDLLQYHVWDYTDDTYLHNLDHLSQLQKQGKIAHIGLTNVDSAHLELLLESGFKIATNQVSCSVIDRRVVNGRLSEVCTEHGVGILAYGTLLGGYISERWLGQPEPADIDSLNWSLRKYLRFIQAAGGWAAFQTVLQALSIVAKRHNCSIATVGMRYVLDIPVVSAIIIGTRLSSDSDKYLEDNLQVFSISLSEEDKSVISEAQSQLKDIPGDCGDEYRRPPFLTASGDLSHHILESDHLKKITEAVAKGQRIEFSSGSKWEPICGYCRAVRTGNIVRVSGTTANSPLDSIPALGGTSPRSQAVAALDIIERALKALGSSLSDVVRTRIMVRKAEYAEQVSFAHGWVFACVDKRPANTLVVQELYEDQFLVEIEAEAEVGTGKMEILRI